MKRAISSLFLFCLLALTSISQEFEQGESIFCDLIAEGNEQGMISLIDQELVTWDFMDYQDIYRVPLHRLMDWLEAHPCIINIDRQRAEVLTYSNPAQLEVRFEYLSKGATIPMIMRIALEPEKFEILSIQ